MRLRFQYWFVVLYCRIRPLFERFGSPPPVRRRAHPIFRDVIIRIYFGKPTYLVMDCMLTCITSKSYLYVRWDVPFRAANICLSQMYLKRMIPPDPHVHIPGRASIVDVVGSKHL